MTATPTPTPTSPWPATVRWWQSLTPRQRLGVGVLAFLVALRLLSGLIITLSGGRGPGGPTSSATATAPDGAAALSELLSHNGHPIVERTTALDASPALDPTATVVVLDPADVSAREIAALRRFVVDGGRLVIGGETAEPAITALVEPAPLLGDGWSGGTIGVSAPLDAVTGVATVQVSGARTWDDTGAAVPVLARGTRPVVAEATLGAGTVVLLADTSMLQNRLLAKADNASFALAAAGPDSRAVVFDEAAHGAGAKSRKLEPFPARWNNAFNVLLIAVVLFMWSRGRRLGPPERDVPSLDPPRRAFVDALAATLAKTRQPAQSIQPLQASVRRAIAAAAVLGADADDATLLAAATRLGLEPDDVRAALREPRTDADVMAIGRLRAALSKKVVRTW